MDESILACGKCRSEGLAEGGTEGRRGKENEGRERREGRREEVKEKREEGKKTDSGKTVLPRGIPGKGEEWRDWRKRKE